MPRSGGERRDPLVHAERQLLQALGEPAARRGRPSPRAMSGRSWPLGRLRGGREDRLGEPRRTRPGPAGSATPHTEPRAPVLLPAGAAEVAAGHALHRDHLGAPHQHRAPGQLRDRRRRGRERRGGPRVSDVVGDEVRVRSNQNSEQRGEHAALVGDGVGQDHVERADAVGGDQQQVRRDRRRRRRGPCPARGGLPARRSRRPPRAASPAGRTRRPRFRRNRRGVEELVELRGASGAPAPRDPPAIASRNDAPSSQASAAARCTIR